MDHTNGPIDRDDSVYLIDELKYFERADASMRELLISGWLFFKEYPTADIAVEVEAAHLADASNTGRAEDVEITKELLPRQDVCDMYDGQNPNIGFRVRIRTKKRFEEICESIRIRISAEMQNMTQTPEAEKSAENTNGESNTSNTSNTSDTSNASDLPTVMVLDLPVTDLSAYRVENVHYMIDQFALNGNVIRMAGWGYISGLYEEYTPLSVWARTSDGTRIGQAEYMMRPDIISLFHDPTEHGKQWGFFLLLDMKEHTKCEICFGSEDCYQTMPVDVDILRREKREKKRRYKNRFEMYFLADAMQRQDDAWYYAHLSKEEREQIVAKRLDYKNVDYDVWIRRHQASQKELKRQRKHCFSYEPKISIAVPAYRTPTRFLQEMIRSVQAQTYDNWELCIADGSLDGSLTEVLKKESEADARIRFQTLDDNYGISGNTNDALKLATGEYISLLDHDDVLSPDCLYEVVKRINETDADCLYTDEDKVDYELEDYFEPHFKPDFNPDMLHSCNYICHFFVVREDVLKRAGLFSSDYDGSQDFDFILRCTAQATKIEHIAKMLYHWRCHAASTAMNPENKMYCYDAGKRAILADLKRAGYEDAQVVNYTRLGYYEPIYPTLRKSETDTQARNLMREKTAMEDGAAKVTERIGNSRITIITHAESIPILKKMRDEKALYENVDFAEIDEFFRDDIRGVMTDDNDGKENIIRDDALNTASGYAANRNDMKVSGEYFLFLDGIVKDAILGGYEGETLPTDWLSLLLANCLRPEVGVIGGMVYNELGRVSSSGKIVGTDGKLRDLFRGLLKEEPGYAAHALMQQDVSAVSLKCLMMSRENFVTAMKEILDSQNASKESGEKGAREKTFQNGDAGSELRKIMEMDGMSIAAKLCRQMLKIGKLVVYTPFVQIKEKQTPEDEDIFVGQWYDGKSDPHYSEAFDEDGDVFTLSL